MSNYTPEDSILTALQEVLGSYEENRYNVTVEKCIFLLKKKKALDSTLTPSVQRLLLMSYLQQQEYNKVLDWVTAQQSNTNGSNNNLHKDLKLYAQYRLEEYDSVAKQASGGGKDILEEHLLAQSQFHLQQVDPALKVYKGLLTKHEQSGGDDETKMELLTNALAILTSTSVPYMSITETANAEEWVANVVTFLESNPDYSDLAFNLGSLEGWSKGNEEWLEEAENGASEGGDDDLVPIQNQLLWNRHFWNPLEEENEIKYNTSDGTAAQVAVAKVNQALVSKSGKFPPQPHPKWNALQLRLYWYNRAISQFHAQKLVECQESCQSLRKTLASSSKSTSKKKKGGASSSTSSTPPSELWWESRVEVILANVTYNQSNKSAALEKLERCLEHLKKAHDSSKVVDHAIAYVLLHIHALEYKSSAPSKEAVKKLLELLPKSVSESRAVVATLDALQVQTSNGAKSPDGTNASKTTPDALFGQGNYEEAAKLYEEQLPKDVSKCDQEEIAQQLRYLQCLSILEHHDKATKLWTSLQQYLEGPVHSNASGEILEDQPLPRSATSSKIGLDVAAAAAGASSKNVSAKRSHEKVLRQRARKREAYLKELEEKGQYNPDRPTKPNPERWIPKHERSSRNRGRRGGGNNRSAQGGGSQADSLRLDAAARRAGTVPASSTPSTANLKVSSGGRRGGRRR